MECWWSPWPFKEASNRVSPLRGRLVGVRDGDVVAVVVEGGSGAGSTGGALHLHVNLGGCRKNPKNWGKKGDFLIPLFRKKGDNNGIIILPNFICHCKKKVDWCWLIVIGSYTTGVLGKYDNPWETHEPWDRIGVFFMEHMDSCGAAATF